jgi:hypothetical protein
MIQKVFVWAKMAEISEVYHHLKVRMSSRSKLRSAGGTRSNAFEQIKKGHAHKSQSRASVLLREFTQRQSTKLGYYAAGTCCVLRSGQKQGDRMF